MARAKELSKKVFRKLAHRDRGSRKAHVQRRGSPGQAFVVPERLETASTNTLVNEPNDTDSDDESADPSAKSSGAATRPQQTPGAERWLEFLKTLKKDEPEKYETLDNILTSINIPTNDQIESLFKSNEHNPESKVLLLRVKAALPSLSAVRGVAMTIANVDPHKIAPYVVAGSFFLLDWVLGQDPIDRRIFLGRISLDDQRKIRNMLFESINAINEWISFETNFVRRTPLVERNVSELEELLPRLERLKAIGDKLSAQMTKWQEDMERLKDHRTSWAAKRKALEETLIRHDYTTKFLDWIKNEDDPEESVVALTDRITSEGRHDSAATWFLENQAYLAWSRDFVVRALGEANTEESDDEESDTGEVDTGKTASGGLDTQHRPRCVLWISGTYGTGKTTIVYRVLSQLQRLADSWLPRIDLMELMEGADLENSTFALRGEGLRVVSYFCDSTKRVNRETVIRALGRKLAFLPDSSVARVALDFFEDKSQGLRTPVYIKEWEGLVSKLLEQCSAMSYHIVLIIDALNEIEPPEDIDHLCNFLGKIVNNYRNISVLISSHEHISSIRRLEKYIDKVGVVANAPKTEIDSFIDGELKHRRTELTKFGDNKSIFCK
ncbi:uncharacterized protein N0V89_011177 [Didymosphaeria variabile]|uniref:Nephrocystin 3-like N-terminal domain-containing protein n=1 Tax=Didymosphaeria variabile TaxID=1932322 RepID=A0A9W8XD06_9PLEO|nr:uncharacterized protein N0V89_011177 [Didymosphaeria variabile]KAJ4347238.1 hypothetical protein N0V89_011177 [Didymosphaeria variabile]